MKPDPIVTAFGPVANPRGTVLRLHRLTTIERSYARQGKAFRPDPIDLRVNQIKLRVHPDWQRIVRSFCIAVAVFAIVYFGGQEFLR
jgi:hypothetical protein